MTTTYAPNPKIAAKAKTFKWRMSHAIQRSHPATKMLTMNLSLRHVVLSGLIAGMVAGCVTEIAVRRSAPAMTQIDYVLNVTRHVQWAWRESFGG